MGTYLVLVVLLAHIGILVSLIYGAVISWRWHDYIGAFGCLILGLFWVYPVYLTAYCLF